MHKVQLKKEYLAQFTIEYVLGKEQITRTMTIVFLQKVK